MIEKYIFILLCILAITKGDNNIDEITCDYYEGLPVTAEQLAFYKTVGVEDTCTLKIKKCDPTSRRSLDGSCNNLNRACRGTYFDPLPRMLEAHFVNGYEPRKSMNGSDLELPRVVRTTLKGEGVSFHNALTSAVPNFAAIMFGDFGSGDDTANFLQKRQYTCDPAYKDDFWSKPVMIPRNDPIHGYAKMVTCMNMTRPLYHQSYNCTQDPVPSPIAKATSVFDLSHVYNYYNNNSDEIRTFTNGLLKVEEENNSTWPPNGSMDNCPTNEANETRCFGYLFNALQGVNVLIVLFYRNHNYFAKNLAEINPCWDDEKLYNIARDINIAMTMQIYLYEFWSTLIGRDNLINARILQEDDCCRNLYNNSLYPSITLEFHYFHRWFHTIQPGHVNLYDQDGNIFYTISNTDLNFRSGFLPKGNNMAGLVAAMTNDPASDDDMIDPEIAERGLGKLQNNTDITSNDLYKGRLFGLAPYVEYLYNCFGVNITKFEQLEEFIPAQKIRLLELVYKDPRDIDAWSGVVSERYVKGGYVPVTLACIFKKYLYKLIRSDRFYYELCDSPTAFTPTQLKEIRKSTFSMFLCNVGDGVTMVQKKGFRIIGAENPKVNCSEIPNIDFKAWADSSCADGSTNCTSEE